MLVSLNELKKYVNLDGLTPEEIAHRLTFAGVEVESINRSAFATKLVVGEVIMCENMENSDHLHVTKVNAGPKYGTLDIVCGAPNCRKGLKVIVALDGCQLKGGTIKKGMIRGHESNGMLCSLLELGVDSKFLSEAQTAGIEELPKDAEVGNEDVLGYLGLDDTILDLKLLANRPDMYSVLNAAKEIKTLFGREVKLPSYKVEENFVSKFPVAINTEKCAQFSARVVKNIKVGESPKWMKDALRSSGIRSINNIVDIGNYVMLLTGQPIHMYDMDKLAKQELVVRDDLELDYVALDEKTYKLQKGDICITSNGKVMCLGGVMGALECAVDENTKNVVVEAANFDYAAIRRTSIRLNLVSDSSQRFVKGINPTQWKFVQDMTASLLKELCGAKEIGEVINAQNKEFKPVVIESSVDYINGRLGTSFSKETIIASLEAAWLKVTEKGDKLVCEVPAHRIDISGEADLAEEVIRINGFENIESKLPSIELQRGGLEPDLEHKREVRNYLRGIGLDEVLCYSLVREKEVKQFAILNKGESYKILNPLTDEHEYLRTNILPSLINTLSYNLNHGNENVAIFEVSDLFTTDGKKHIHLAVACVGNDLRRGAMAGEPYGYYHLKGVLDGILKAFSIDEKRTVLERCKEKEFHPGKSALVKVDGKPVAVLGELHPTTLKELDLAGDNVAVMEVDLGQIFATKTSATKMQQISKYQTVKRDFAFVLADNITSKEVVNEIFKVNREVIKSVEVFDIYHGEHVKEGHYSMAVSVSLNDANKTLGEQDIVALEQAIIKALETKFGAELRK